MGGLSDLAIFLVPLTATTFLYYLMIGFPNVKKDPREVPSIPPSVPFVGHVLGIMRHKMLYYVKLR